MIVIAFIDFTEPIRQQILAHFPHLATPPLEGLDSPLPPPPLEGIPLAYPPSRSTFQTEGGNIWSGLGTIVPISGKCPDPSQPKPEGTDSEAAEPVNTPHEHASSKNVDQGTSIEGRNFFTSNGQSLSAGMEDLGHEEENEHSLSDEETYGPSSEDALGHLRRSNELIDDHPVTWHDIALSIAASLTLKMRDEVKQRLGYTTSAVRMIWFRKNELLRYVILQSGHR